MSTGRGFTLIELVVTLALVGLLAMVALPLYEIATIRVRETELRVSLRQIRVALDAYKAASDAGQIARQSGETGYPSSLRVLVDGVENLGDIKKPRLVFMRRLPRDPFSMDHAVPAEQTWTLRGYASPSDDPSPGPEVFDVSSRSPRKGLNGVLYKEW